MSITDLFDRQESISSIYKTDSTEYNDTIITIFDEIYSCKVTSIDRKKIYYHFKPRNGKLYERNIPLTKVKYCSKMNFFNNKFDSIQNNNSTDTLLNDYKLKLTHRKEEAIIEQNSMISVLLKETKNKRIEGPLKIITPDLISINNEEIKLNSIKAIYTLKEKPEGIFSLVIGAIFGAGGVSALVSASGLDGLAAAGAAGTGAFLLLIGIPFLLIGLAKSGKYKKLYSLKYWSISIAGTLNKPSNILKKDDINKKKHPLRILSNISLILGLLIFLAQPLLGAIGILASIVFGIMGKNRAKANPEKYR